MISRFNLIYMNVQDSKESLRRSLQNKIYKLILISIGLSFVIFSIKKEGFFFGIH